MHTHANSWATRRCAEFIFAAAVGALLLRVLAPRLNGRPAPTRSRPHGFEHTSVQPERSTERERRFAGQVSHELRTPVSGLMTASEYLATTTTEAGPETQEAVEIVLHHARRLGVLVEELLELADLGGGESSIRTEAVDLRRLVDAVLTRTNREATIDGADVLTMSDKRRLGQIASILITNAYEHGEGRGVRVSIGHNDRQCWISVSDEGPGIPRADVPRLFDHFFQGTSSVDRRRGGIGMGLPIAMENARLLGGTLRVDSPARGTRITAELPYRPVHEP
jgi:two-component system sensor histidine kinase MtrB